MTILYYDYRSPIGILRIHANDNGITALSLEQEQLHSDTHPHLTQAASQLEEYFTNKRTTFDLPLAINGTDFQRNVWQALQAIPFGHTASYADIASTINNPKAVRAVGSANNRNPLPIIIPCHRIIGKNGSLTGYAYGLEIKQWLLNHERETLSC